MSRIAFASPLSGFGCSNILGGATQGVLRIVASSELVRGVSPHEVSPESQANSPLPTLGEFNFELVEIPAPSAYLDQKGAARAKTDETATNRTIFQ